MPSLLRAVSICTASAAFRILPNSTKTAGYSARLRPYIGTDGLYGRADLAGNQAHFAAVAACDVRDNPVFSLISEISDAQQWGLGTLPNTRFKGGWGPNASGSYSVRQFGVSTTRRGIAAIAPAAQPNSGSFSDGTAALSKVASWLLTNIGAVPTGTCVT
jgi:hypothetical protein